MALVCLIFSNQASAEFETYYLPSEIDRFINETTHIVDLVEEVSWDHLDPLGYKKGSKPALFGYVDLQRDEEGYYIKDVYCNKKIRNRVGPNRIPNNNIMNAEHTWPQSKGSNREPFRGDLHHLFPTDSKANSIRGNYPFGEVSGDSAYFGCESSKKGNILNPETGESTGQRGYEPPDGHKGNVARALFYSAAMYGIRISDLEEHYLRKWHKEDPVDQDEIKRNDSVEESQGNRNPFIDFPHLVDRVDNF
jgi:endonuclease I